MVRNTAAIAKVAMLENRSSQLLFVSQIFYVVFKCWEETLVDDRFVNVHDGCDNGFIVA
jgi:hypothetical protein